MECEYPGSCAGPTPLNPDVLPSHTLRVVLTPGWSNGRGERPSLIPTFLPAPSGAEAALGGSAEVGSAPKMWINANANMGPSTLTSGEAPLVFPSRSGLRVSKVLFFFNPIMDSNLYFWQGFCLLLEPGCSQLLLSQPLDLGVG